MTTPSSHSGIQITEVRVRNYRSLKSVDMQLGPFTVLIGENNSGKTSLLEALFAAIGAGRRVITQDDVFLDNGESKVPKDREVLIDILIHPVNEEGILGTFPEGSFWVELWGSGIAQYHDTDNDFVAIRTRTFWNHGKAEYVTERRFLKEWPDSDSIENAQVQTSQVTARHLEPMAFYLMDAKRDIHDELQNRSSFWHKLISEPGLSDQKIGEIEETLSKLNQEIIDGSDVLTHVQGHLNDLYQTVSANKGDVSITPLARHMRDLNRGMDISFCTRDAQTFPLSRHGMGTRSIAAILTFRAYSNWRQMNADGGIHSFLALEEPEAHLHPQAQRAIFQQIEAIPGQRIISTHSPYVASRADIGNFRHFKKNGSTTHVTQLDVSDLNKDDIRKINRMVLNTRGELLFARALVFFEGETEEQALPIFAEQFWGQSPCSLGISFIPVEGYKGYLPFVRLAKSFEIPWYIFSDGEEDPIRWISRTLKKVGNPEEPENNHNVFIIPDNKNFEGYLADEKYKDIIIETIIEVQSVNENHIDALKQQWANETDKLAAIKTELSKAGNKTKYATPVAAAISNMDDIALKFPPLVRELFDQMAADLDLTPTHEAPE
ncbi:ATP-dependent endonuclease [Geothermobacter hydrogeniphilus]|uniref:ATP-dependent endonuclease n=1 Tax=Geothermobacter hydrogeniphilus TaxID=1969733 RepID=A0A2K2H5K1_9BACT|nr:AAA family ATPase [Geothermobacter hydrogeniphilus]PNU18605.1 ATP-dependent endonuclease [Geothermobacter hydrogeniphilus]